MRLNAFPVSRIKKRPCREHPVESVGYSLTGENPWLRHIGSTGVRMNSGYCLPCRFAVGCHLEEKERIVEGIVCIGTCRMRGFVVNRYLKVYISIDRGK